jgi:hypothetical protein
LGRGARIPNVDSISPENRIHGIEDLLVRYFILTGIDNQSSKLDPASEQSSPEIIPFVKKLPGRIKRIKITTERELETTRGEVRGPIDWQETVKTRQSRGAMDHSLFVYGQTNREIQTTENIVLATLIDRIYSIVANELSAARKHPEKYAWLEPWISDESRLWKTIEQLKFQNPYISQIHIEEKPISGRDIQEVKSARSPLYRESAKLLERYQNYKSGEYSRAELRGLFNTLFVGPEAMDELFELYWAYKILTAYPAPTLEAVTGATREVARWTESGNEYRLHYRSTGSEAPYFFIGIDDAREELEILDQEISDKASFLQRYRTAIDKAADAKSELLGKKSVERAFWRGQPDILLTKRDTETEVMLGVFIGEVKYTDSTNHSTIQNRAAEGIDDLTEYMELIRDSLGEYVSRKGGETYVRGAAFTPPFDPVEKKKGNLQIITFGEEMQRII